MKLTPEMSDDLRNMVRDVLREVMAQRSGAPAQVPRTEQVRIANDADLAAFVARITAPEMLDLVRSRSLRFTLGGTAIAAPAAAAGAAISGVITEQKIDQFKSAGAIVLAPGAVLTPLARDKARRLGLTIERRR